MRKMINAVQLVERENGNYDVVNYHRPTNLFENGEQVGVSYKVGYNMPYQMALAELKRAEVRAVRTHGTFLIEVEA